MGYVLSFDLGTGGLKSALYDKYGEALAAEFIPYDTYYPQPGFHEQAPVEWWNALVASTKHLIHDSKIDVHAIAGLAISGHSLGVVPVGTDGALLLQRVPIWSDSRACEEAKSFFESVDETAWYMATGNGFPPSLYSIFKIMWYKRNFHEVYEKASKFVGTKDYLNYRLTGVFCTDHSYASGSGAYDLATREYREDFIEASGIRRSQLPEIRESADTVGNLTEFAARELGLPASVKVICGGVDNACTALGASCIDEGDTYTALGTSAWIAVSSHKPILRIDKRPYVFAHCIPGMNVSATSIFAAGNSIKWVRDVICKQLVEKAERESKDAYALMDELAATSPIGSHGLVFNPTLAGGSSLDKSPCAKGAYTGLTLGHTLEDLIRAAMEGVALNLRIALDILKESTSLSKDMLIVGGGAKSELWRQIFADVYNMPIVTTNFGQNAGALGAAGVAAVGTGLWEDFSVLKVIDKRNSRVEPIKKNRDVYDSMVPLFKRISDTQSDIGEEIANLQKRV